MYLKESSVFLVSIIFHIQTRKCTKLFTENKVEYFAHALTVCTRPLLGGGGRGLGMRLLLASFPSPSDGKLGWTQIWDVGAESKITTHM